MFGHINFLKFNVVILFWMWPVFVALMTALFYFFFKVVRFREFKIRDTEAAKIELEKFRTQSYKARLEREEI
ncbi:MAG: hypothetical protein ABI267_07725, partial [Ginsengibacter sp.]